MKITTARRLAQIAFFALFVWLSLVATVGSGWTQWRGWPIGWFLQLDPLVALGTVLTTASLHPLLAWSLVTIGLTILFGRVFCGFVCPFGALHQFVGWLGRLGKHARDRVNANTYRRAQVVKYYVLIVMLAAASGDLVLSVVQASHPSAKLALGLAAVGAVSLYLLTLRKIIPTRRTAIAGGVIVLTGWALAAQVIAPEHVHLATLQIGWLDPIPLLYRSFNLTVLPAADLVTQAWFPSGRLHSGASLIGAIFIGSVLANLILPRFFCRVLCPLGALLGVIGRFAPWGIGKTIAKCSSCSRCDFDCEGACQPAGPIRPSECLMCLNCLDNCPTTEPLAYARRPSIGGEITEHGITRRGFVAAVATGAVAAPLARLGGTTKSNWAPGLVRPPGSVSEEEFLARCLKCGECIRVCPTNVLQPAGFEFGWEAGWTPTLNNRIGTSGCQLNCIACGHACPTGAIRPVGLDEKHGTGEFADRGPIRIGLAAVDRGRCLPWAMDRPCIVCEENCPVTPKAIGVSVVETTVRDGAFTIADVQGATLRVTVSSMVPGQFATGDYSAKIADASPARRIVANTADTLTLEPAAAPDTEPAAAGAALEVQVRLQRPVVDPARCIGCGICEHECPLSGRRAIRITADNETRNPAHAVLLRGSR